MSAMPQNISSDLQAALEKESVRRKKAEQELKWLSYLVRYNPNTVIITDTKGRIEYVNSVFTSITGYTEEEVVGRCIDDLSLHNFSSKGYCWNDLLDGIVFESEVRSRKKNGELFDEQVFLLPMADKHNIVSRIAIIKRDISVRKHVERDLVKMNEILEQRVRDLQYTEMELAHSNDQNELILNSVGEGIFGVDIEGSITFMNPAAEMMTGYRSDELIGHTYDTFLCRFGQETSLADLTNCPVSVSLQKGQVGVSEEEIFYRKDGSTFHVELVSSPTKEDTTVIGAVVTFRDITEQLQVKKGKEQAEKELRELTDTLEKQVLRRTAQLRTSNQELIHMLDQLQKAQSHVVQSEKMASLGGLVAGVAHEINTPVGIAFTAATHLEKISLETYSLYKNGQMKRKDLDEYLENCIESTRLLSSNLSRAGALIRSFKQVAIDQSGEARRTFRVRDYLYEILLSLRPILKNTAHKIEIDCDKKFELNSYPGAFSQVVTNLITNSVTHGYSNGDAGHCFIKVAMNEKELVMTYSDDGKGIAAADLPHIFDPFFTTGSEKGGSGLGLHIIYNIITQKLNGSISCKSTPPRGTSFIIKIPV